LLTLASASTAQVASTFRDLPPSLQQGDPLLVTERSGVLTHVRFVDAADRSLRAVVAPARRIVFPEASVKSIAQIRSSKGRGALIGLALGALAGLVAIAVSPPCDGLGCPDFGGAVYPVSAAFFGGIGAGVGVAIGAHVSRHHLIFLAP
jgi:hypothetical protein